MARRTLLNLGPKRILLAAGLTAALVVGGVAVTATATPATTRSTSSTERFTDDALFRGVLFLQGDVGRLAVRGTTVANVTGIPQLVKSLNTAASIKLAKTIEKQIASAHPAFLTAFHSALTSGDPTRVDGAVTTAGQYIQATPFVKAQKSANTTYVPGQAGPDCAYAVVVGIALVIAAGAIVVLAAVLLLNTAAGVNVAVTRTKVKTKAATPLGSTAEQQQEWNANLTAKFA